MPMRFPTRVSGPASTIAFRQKPARTWAGRSANSRWRHSCDPASRNFFSCAAGTIPAAMKNKLLLATLLFTSMTAAAAERPGEWKALLDPSFSKFDVYLSYRGNQIMSVLKGTAPADLKPVGLNPPGQTVFTMIEQDGKPVLRISGEIYGCATTREAFSNYHFRASFKWGEKKWEPRLTELKDSGILYHSRGDFGVDYWKSWALSQEFQVIEHGIGEYGGRQRRPSISAPIRKRLALKRRGGTPRRAG